MKSSICYAFLDIKRALQVNTFEQASSHTHQMSLTGGKPVSGPGGGCTMMYKVQRSLYSAVQSIMGNDHMGRPNPCEQTDTTKNIAFQQIYWWVVIRVCNYSSCLCNLDVTLVFCSYSKINLLHEMYSVA